MLSKYRREAAREAIECLRYFRSIEWHDTLDSTNRHLARCLKSSEPFPVPALVIAEAQSSGVGRGKNAWWSPHGCLMFSMALTWPPSADNYARLPLRVGLAVAETLSTITISKPLVKWPNDVVLENRKVCGILIESSSRSALQAATQEMSIIGIGINCQVDFAQAPPELRSTAISLHEVAASRGPESTTPEAVLVAFLQHWLTSEARQVNDPHWMDRVWNEWSWLEGKWVEASLPDRKIVGTVRGINENGALRLQDRHGRMHAILSASVRALDGDHY